jgi:hypothetical protein
MKKIFLALALAFMLMVPMSSFAATTVSDSDLAAITGQSGVSIDLAVTVNLTADVVAWGDSDGLQNIQGYGTLQGDDAYNAAGYVGLSMLNITNLHIAMRSPLTRTQASDAEWDAINALEITNATTNGGAGNPLTQGSLLVALFQTNNKYSNALTIDVGSAGAKTIVSIGVPTFDLTMQSMTADVALFNQETVATNNPYKIPVTTGTPQVLGSLNVSNLEMLFWGGRVDISAEAVGHEGVDISLKNVQIESISAGGISWGDADGVTNGLGVNSAGYVGIGGKNMIQNLKLNGDITIDVASIDTAVLNALWNDGTAGMHYVGSMLTKPLESQLEMIYAGKKILGTPASVVADNISYVHLGLNNFDINIQAMYMPVYLWNTPNVVDGGVTHQLGVVYVKNLDVTAGGYVNIMAH